MRPLTRIFSLLAIFFLCACIPEAEVAPGEIPDANQSSDAGVDEADPDVDRDCIEGSDEDLCAAQGLQCGTHEVGQRCDVARADIRCGDCPWPKTCDDASQCDCKPRTCEDLNAECGTHDDGCGGLVSCAPCDEGLTCTHRAQLPSTGGSNLNPEDRDFLCTDACTPIPEGLACVEVQCGAVPDGCGGMIDCGDPAEVCDLDEPFGDWEFLSEENCCNGLYNSCTCVEEIRRVPACIDNQCVLVTDGTRTVRSGCSSCFPRVCSRGTCGVF